MTTIESYFNWVDFAIIGIILFSVIISFFRGFVRETISLVAWVVGAILAVKFANSAQAYLQPWVAPDTLRYAVAFMGLFLVVFLVGIILNILIHVLIHRTGLTLTDRLLGIFFGVGRGLLIVAVLLMFVSVGPIKDGSVLAQSRLAPEFKPMMVWLNQFLPLQLKHFSQWLFNQPVR